MEIKREILPEALIKVELKATNSGDDDDNIVLPLEYEEFNSGTPESLPNVKVEEILQFNNVKEEIQEDKIIEFEFLDSGYLEESSFHTDHSSESSMGLESPDQPLSRYVIDTCKDNYAGESDTSGIYRYSGVYQTTIDSQHQKNVVLLPDKISKLEKEIRNQCVPKEECDEVGTNVIHDSSSEEISSKSGSGYKCKLCGRVYKHNSSLALHMKVHNKVKPFVCEICKKAFVKKYHLEIHIRIHTGEKPYKCNLCEKCFSTSSRLTTHKNSHIPGAGLVCDKCDKVFKSKGNLREHKKLHSNIKPFLCKICERAFVKKYDLFRHNRIHTIDKPYKCDICEKNSTKPSEICVHKQLHTCNMCDKVFKYKFNLTTHMKIHYNIKPFVCEVCEKAFIKRSDLNRHSRKHTRLKTF